MSKTSAKPATESASIPCPVCDRLCRGSITKLQGRTIREKHKCPKGHWSYLGGGSVRLETIGTEGWAWVGEKPPEVARAIEALRAKETEL